MHARHAYRAAGDKPHDGNASRLRNNEQLMARIKELKSESLDYSAVTIGEVVAKLRASQAAAEEAGQHTAAIKALELLGKTVAAFIDTNANINLGSMSDDELLGRVMDLVNNRGDRD
jgi:hypothetical protein